MDIIKKRIKRNRWHIYWYYERKMFEVSTDIPKDEEKKAEVLRIKTNLHFLADEDCPEAIRASKSYQRYIRLLNTTEEQGEEINHIDRYINHITPNVSKTWKYENRRVIEKFQKEHDIYTTTDTQAQRYIDEIAAKRTPSTVNHHLKILKKYCNWLVKHYGLGINPFRGIKSLKERRNNIDIVYATKEERKKILEIADMHEQSLALWLAHYCGLRRGEIYSIKKEHVNFDAETIIILGKGGKVRTVSMPDIIVNKVKEQLEKKLKSDYLLPFDSTYRASARILVEFINRTIDMLKISKKDKQRLKAVSGFQVGRRSFCTHMIQAGVPIEIVAHIAGHAPEVARRHYMRFIPKDKKDKRIELIN